MNCPDATSGAVAAYKVGQAPLAVACPKWFPKERLAVARKPPPPPRAAPAPTRLLRVHPGWAATAMVDSPTLVQASAQLRGEEEIGQFRRAVVRPRRADPQTGDIVEVDVTDAVHDGAHRHHPRAAGDQESLEDQAGEGEVPQVIGGHLELETVRGLPVRRPHHPGVVDEEIQPRRGGPRTSPPPVRRRPDRRGRASRARARSARARSPVRPPPDAPSPGHDTPSPHGHRDRRARAPSRTQFHCWRP